MKILLVELGKFCVEEILTLILSGFYTKFFTVCILSNYENELFNSMWN